jgi:Tfp pilus assembly protein PilF
MSQNPTSPERSANIFINYRREDSAGHTGRLFDRLSTRLPGRVFMDIDNLEPGVDFAEVIEKAVGSCEVLIVVMGHEWLRVTDAAGHRRLDDPADFVRMEVAAALQRAIRVIPVLVQGAPMPRAEELPADIAKLARRNAIELSDARWAYDVDRLIHTIEQVLKGLDLRASEAAAAPAAAAAAAPAAPAVERRKAAPAAAAAPAAERRKAVPAVAAAPAASATRIARPRAASPRAWMAALAAVIVCGLALAGWKVVTQQIAHGVVVPAPTAAPAADHRAPATPTPATPAPAAPAPGAPAAAPPAPAAPAPAGRAAAAQATTELAPTSAAKASGRPVPAPAAPAAAVPAPAPRAAAVAQASTPQVPASTAKAPGRAVPTPAIPVPPAPAAASQASAAPVSAAPLTAGPSDRPGPSAGPTAADANAALAAPGGQAKSATAYGALGLKYLDEGHYDEAIAALTSAIKLSRNVLSIDALDALYARSMAYNRSGRASEAISDLESLLKARDDPHTREELAIAYAQVGRREDAIEQYRLLLKPHPDDAWFNVQVGFLYIKNADYKKAAQAYEKALANRKQLSGSPLIAEAYDNLGIAYFHLCWREEAIAAFQKATELKPEYATGLANAQRLRCQRL